MKDRLTELIGDKEGLNKGLINKIATFQYLAEEQEKKGANQSWKWIMAYDFARATQRIKNSDAKQLLNELKVDTLANTQKGKKLNSKHTTLALCNLAARWAELTIR
ncbi:MAG: hypothetical protein IPJ86_06015 [Bacteroidetes bacterium]|nr:hypothetical protein [Bacteroidota bacterium]